MSEVNVALVTPIVIFMVVFMLADRVVFALLATARVVRDTVPGGNS